MTRLLVADDQADVREALRLVLKPEGFRVEGASTPAALLAAVEADPPDVVLLDMNYARDTTSGREGLDLLERLRVLDPDLPLVVMTAWGSIDLAVDAMKRGARDFLTKPWENTRLVATLRTQAELASALRRARRLEAGNRILSGSGLPPFIAPSRAMAAVLDLVNRIAPSEANVLILGENGTGKSLLARLIHAESPRAALPLLTLNAGGLSEGILESELFGHVRGAFTDARQDRAGRFELADGGTLFLDEIGNAPAGLQGKLLRVLETGEFERVGSSRTVRADVRVISATNADLEGEVAAGRFRQDLRFRLNTLEISIPPLRERRDDVVPLALHFLGAHAKRYRKEIAGLTPAAVTALERHPWPGNVRELDHAVERAVLLSAGDRIDTSDLTLSPPRDATPAALAATLDLEEMEALLIRKALAQHGSAPAAAEALGLSRSALYRRLQKLGLGGAG